MLDWIWPVGCVGCGELGREWCPHCGPGSLLRPRSRSIGVERVFSVERYERPAGQALKRAKVHGDYGTLSRLAHLFANRLAPALGPVDAIVPAPSSWRSRTKRGFSAASLFAAALGRRIHTPIHSILRSTAKVRLATLSAEQRRVTLRGQIRAITDLPGRVVLVDDVLTSGATAESCALELLGGSTSEVLLATFCAVKETDRDHRRAFVTRNDEGSVASCVHMR